ncbi:hypothetical protein DBR06_SOUSAS31010006, partial [Sousa chinensis]
QVTLADQVLDQRNKTCSFKSLNSWYPMEDTVDIFRCCNKAGCGIPG